MMINLAEFNNLDSKIISPDNPMLTYSGRIDFSNEEAPVLVYPASYIEINFTGTSCSIILENKNAYWDNYLGFILDGQQGKLKLSKNQEITLLKIADNLSYGRHSLMVFKRMDSCHIFAFYGFLVDRNCELLPCNKKPKRRIEVYGDSVSAGEVSEAVDYVGKPDPSHNGEYSNSYYSYAWFTARKLNAQLHNIAQGGISLLDGSGYFLSPDTIGIMNTYDKIEYHPELSKPKLWDFSLYTPQVVIVAIGQNDNYPIDYMKEDINCHKSKLWRSNYKRFIIRLREHYPNALIILTTTILRHDNSWDRAIDMVSREINDPKIKHFLYTNNGCGTDGHIRISEADTMSDELCDFINSFGEEIWLD